MEVLKSVPIFVKTNKMKPTFNIICRESGDLIDTTETHEFAEYIIAEFERQDKEDGCYTPDFYQITVKTEA